MQQTKKLIEIKISKFQFQKILIKYIQKWYHYIPNHQFY